MQCCSDLPFVALGQNDDRQAAVRTAPAYDVVLQPPSNRLGTVVPGAQYVGVASGALKGIASVDYELVATKHVPGEAVAVIQWGELVKRGWSEMI